MTAQTASLTDDDTRFTPRTQLFLSATIRFERVCTPIRMRDLSATGARIEGGKLPDVAATVHITRGPLNASGTIIWRNQKGCGVRFDEPLPLDQWMPALASRDQPAVDESVGAVQSGNAQVLPFFSQALPAEALGNALPQRLAEELAYVGRLLESLGEDLCAEPLLVMRHAVKLQNLDVSAQILGHVAALLVAEQPEQAIDAIGMVSLRKRLRRTAL